MNNINNILLSPVNSSTVHIDSILASILLNTAIDESTSAIYNDNSNLLKNYEAKNVINTRYRRICVKPRRNLAKTNPDRSIIPNLIKPVKNHNSPILVQTQRKRKFPLSPFTKINNEQVTETDIIEFMTDKSLARKTN